MTVKMNTAHTGKGIPSSTVKLIAILCMLIDHTAAVILDRMLLNNGLVAAVKAGEDAKSLFLQHNAILYTTDLIMRSIGRIAFPLFCFLLIEGYLHTHSVKRYALSLGVFALISEIPFNLAFRGDWKDLTYQNVFFTLLIGLIMMIFLEKIDKRYNGGRNWTASMLKIAVIVAAALLAFFLRTDYGAYGILCIAMMYNLRQNKMYCITVGCLVLTLMSFSEIFCFLALIPVRFYNGLRGLNLKYSFYAFYPIHLLLLFLIAVLMGLGGVSML